MKKTNPLLLGVFGMTFLLIFGLDFQTRATLKTTPTPTRTRTATATLPNTPTQTQTPSFTQTATVIVPSYTATNPSVDIQPYPDAPLCVHPNNSTFHTLWNSEIGCHYDHEHSVSPFTSEVVATFPGFDLFALLGGVQVGHTNPSSPMENTHKHGGFKWDVTLSHSVGCETGPGAGNAAGVGVDAFVSQYHGFGDYSIEFETRIHSAVVLMRQCLNSNPSDKGYAYFVQWQDYGQRTVPYQGTVYPYPDTPLPAYASPLAPYFSIGCIGPVIQCRVSREFVLSKNANSDSTWVSVPQAAPIGSPLFALLFRVRDAYQLVEWSDQVYPFTFRWLCSTDGGLTFAPLVGCRYNNTTTRIHELHGTIPAEWDNTPMDSDPRVGRITAQGYVTAFGEFAPECTQAGAGCFPFKLVNAFVGRYRSTFALVSGKGTFSAENLPERDIYFCNGVVCSESTPGAVSSGWAGGEN